MSYHTARLQKLLTREEVQFLLNHISVRIPDLSTMKEDFLDDTITTDDNGRITIKCRSLKIPTRKSLHNINKGFLSIQFKKWINMTSRKIGYGLQVLIDLECMLHNKYTNELYTASETNNHNLFAMFADAMYTLFPSIENYKPFVSHRLQSELRPYCTSITSNDIDELEMIAVTDEENEEDFIYSQSPINNEYGSNIGSIPYMPMWQVKQIDAAYNIAVSDKSLYLRLCRASFKDSSRLKLEPKWPGNDNITATSRGRNRTLKFLMYDKEQEINYHITTKRKTWKRKLLTPEIRNVIRYEIAIKPYREWIFTHCNLDHSKVMQYEPIYGILPFLTESISDTILQAYYEMHISNADWYSNEQLTDALADLSNNRIISKQLHRTLADGIVPLISIAGGVNDALPLFTEGINLDSWSNDELFGGMTQKTFNSYINSRHATNLQPVALDAFTEATEFPNQFIKSNIVLQGPIDTYQPILVPNPGRKATNAVHVTNYMNYTHNIDTMIAEHNKHVGFDFDKWLERTYNIYKAVLIGDTASSDVEEQQMKLIKRPDNSFALMTGDIMIRHYPIVELIQKWMPTKYQSEYLKRVR